MDAADETFRRDALPDLWSRLARLDLCCDITFRTVRLRDDRGGEHRRWAVVAQRRANPDEYFEVVATSTARALSQAVLEAERRGWNADPPLRQQS